LKTRITFSYKNLGGEKLREFTLFLSPLKDYLFIFHIYPLLRNQCMISLHLHTTIHHLYNLKNISKCYMNNEYNTFNLFKKIKKKKDIKQMK